MVTIETLRHCYNEIYRHTNYQNHKRRVPFFVDWLSERLQPGARVLDVGCGRGHLIRALLEKGYHAHGTEIADILTEPYHDLDGLSVRIEDLLDMADERAWDAVVCSDVLEHLPGEQAVENALQRLSRASRRYLLVSASWTTSHVPIPDLPLDDLHLVIASPEWWQEQFEKVCTVEWRGTEAASLFLFGEVRR